jgi:hypothetical protein
MTRKKPRKRPKAPKDQQGRQTPAAESGGKKRGNLLKKVRVSGRTLSIIIIILLSIAAFILDQIPTHRRFSIETTAKGIDILTDFKDEKTFLQMTAHPVLKMLTVSAQKLNISTSDFVILETNQPNLKTMQPSSLKVDSTEQTYYHISNNQSTTIPTIIAIQPNQANAKTAIRFKRDKENSENLATIELPPSNTKLDISAKETTLTINSSQISYGNKQANTDGKEILITGKPNKIDINMESSGKPEITFRTKKGTTYSLELDEKAIRQITNLEFLDASKETTIYLDPKEKVPIKDDFVKNPKIRLKGKIVSIKQLEITDNGIAATLEGKYVRIKIAETNLANTVLDDVLRFLDKIWKYVTVFKS